MGSASAVRQEERGNNGAMHRLQGTEQSHDQEKIPFTTNRRFIQPTSRSTDILKDRFMLGLPPTEEQARIHREDSVSEQIWPLRIPGNAIWSNKFTSSIHGSHEPNIHEATRQVCNRLHRQHSNLLQITRNNTQLI